MANGMKVNSDLGKRSNSKAKAIKQLSMLLNSLAIPNLRSSIKNEESDTLSMSNRNETYGVQGNHHQV